MVVTQRFKLGTSQMQFRSITAQHLACSVSFSNSKFLKRCTSPSNGLCVTCTQNNNTHAFHIINKKGHKRVIQKSVSAVFSLRVAAWIVHVNIAHQVSYSKSYVGNKQMQLCNGDFLILSFSLDQRQNNQTYSGGKQKKLTSLPAVTAK